MLFVIVLIEWSYRNSANILVYFRFLLRIRWGARNERELNAMGQKCYVLPEKLATPEKAAELINDKRYHIS